MQRVFPQHAQSMKMAEISPVFKKQDHLQKGNYRPVSILTTFSKLLEQQLAKQLQTHFEGLFDDYVSAYRKGYSCQSVLLDLIDQWRTALDNKFYIGALFMDLSKCFDCMPHALLISKL